jgi:hypothetical protein
MNEAIMETRITSILKRLQEVCARLDALEQAVGGLRVSPPMASARPVADHEKKGLPKEGHLPK